MIDIQQRFGTNLLETSMLGCILYSILTINVGTFRNDDLYIDPPNLISLQPILSSTDSTSTLIFFNVFHDRLSHKSCRLCLRVRVN